MGNLTELKFSRVGLSFIVTVTDRSRDIIYIKKFYGKMNNLLTKTIA